MLLPNSDSNFWPLKSRYLRDDYWFEKKACFIQEAGNLGRSQTYVQKLTLKTLLIMRAFRGRKGKLVVANHLGRGSSS